MDQPFTQVILIPTALLVLSYLIFWGLIAAIGVRVKITRDRAKTISTTALFAAVLFAFLLGKHT